MSWTRCSESKCGNESPVFQSVKCSFVVFVWQNCRENALNCRLCIFVEL